MLSQVVTRDHIVLVVDDDQRICEALTDLLSTYDLHVDLFGSAAEYNAYPKPDVPACLLLDIELPDVNGLDLLDQTGEQPHPPARRVHHGTRRYSHVGSRHQGWRG